VSRRWLPLAVVIAAIAGVALAVWMFGLLAAG
jgi:hypothetical protein